MEVALRSQGKANPCFGEMGEGWGGRRGDGGAETGDGIRLRKVKTGSMAVGCKKGDGKVGWRHTG